MRRPDWRDDGCCTGGRPRLPSAPAGSAARHLQLAGRDAEAAEAFRLAGQLARGVFANGEALEHFRAALALGHHDRIGLQVVIGDLQTVTGDYAGALLTLEAAASESGPDDLVAVEQRLGRLQYQAGRVRRGPGTSRGRTVRPPGPQSWSQRQRDRRPEPRRPLARDLSGAQVLAHRAKSSPGTPVTTVPCARPTT